MEWWQRSITSNIDIKGECNIAPAPVHDEIDDEILFITDEENHHVADTLELIHSLLPTVKVRIIQAKNAHEAATQLVELINTGQRSKMLLCQWYTTKNAEIDGAIRSLINKCDFLVVASAGNKNVPFKELSPLNVKEVMKIGSYNRSGTISAMCNRVNCDYYFPGTSIKIGGVNKKGTSYAAAIAAISLLILKHKLQSRSYKEFRYVHLKAHEQVFGGGYRIILNKVYKQYQFPDDVDIDDAGRLMYRNQRLSFYLDWRDGFEKMPLIDAMGLAIKDLNRDDIVIPMSGGIDSESVAQACLKHDVKFRTAIMRYIYDGEIQNEHDYCYAESFCELHGLEPTYLDLDLNWFFEESEKFLEYTELCGSSSPQFSCHLWMLDQIDGFPIMPSDPVETYQHPGDTRIAVPFFRFYAYDRYFQARRKEGIAHMLMYNTNIIMNSLLITTPDLGNPNRKLKFFRDGGFKVDYNRTKQTGFEKIRYYYSDKYNEEHTVRTFNNFFRAPLKRYFQNTGCRSTNVFVDQRYRNILNEATEHK